jgi:16S rRNA (guanine966-N2)-methyltransferase
LRIISGKYRGKPLHPPSNLKARPTTDFAKESLFNILNNYFDFAEAQVLELFAGSGSISYEFASRECKSITAIEIDPVNFSYIARTVKEMGLTSITPLRTDVFRFIGHCRQSYDIIFADPPYEMENIEKLPQVIFEKKLLNKNGWFILEHSKRHNFKDFKEFREERNYGNVHFSFFYEA